MDECCLDAWTVEQRGMAGPVQHHQMGAALPAESDITGVSVEWPNYSTAG